MPQTSPRASPHPPALARVLKSPSHLGSRLASIAQNSIRTCHPGSVPVLGMNKQRWAWPPEQACMEASGPAFCPGATNTHAYPQAKVTLTLPLPLFQVPGPSSWFPTTHPWCTSIPRLACGSPAPPP